MKTFLQTLILFASADFFVVAQTNLVSNGSFELFTICPPTWSPGSPDFVTYATGWRSSNGSPDYLHSCATSTLAGVPINMFGFQNAFTGNAYCGMGSYFRSMPLDMRETITSQLITPLIVGQKYYVSYRASLADEKNFTYCGIDKLGTLFSTQLYDLISPAPINNYSQVYCKDIITDKTNWSLIYGAFIADSAYNYISIGCFYKDVNLNLSYPINPNTGSTYYYIDDVRVSTDSLLVLSLSEDFSLVSTITIFPNPTSDNLTISLLGLKEKENTLYEISDNLGLRVREGNISFNSGSAIITTNCLAPGLYFIRLKTRFGVFTKKFVKSD